jgi:hypothetical protein
MVGDGGEEALSKWGLYGEGILAAQQSPNLAKPPTHHTHVRDSFSVVAAVAFR